MKILIVHKNWLGDVLFQIPAVEAIRKAYPDAYIASVAPLRCREILSAHPDVNEVIVFDEKSQHRSLPAKLAFAFNLRKEKFDKVFLLQHSRTRSVLFRLSGVKERIGYGKGRKWFLTKAVSEPKQRMHQVDYFLSLLRDAGIPAGDNARYRFYFSDAAEQRALQILKQHGLEPRSFLCFHLGANWEPKRWPVSRFAELADKIYERWRLPIVITGGSDDLKLFLQLKKEIRQARVISVVGETSLEELGALFQKALCLVSSDSGPMHIASGVGTAVVALFGPTNPEWTGPRGVGDSQVLSFVPPGYSTPWYGKDLPKSGWLSQIGAQEVYEVLTNKGWLETGAAVKQPPHSGAKGRAKENNDRGKQKILFITLSSIGDVILTVPALMNLRSRFPDAEISVVCGPRARGILEGSASIDDLIIYDKKAGVLNQLKFLMSLRRKKYDLVVDLRNTAIPFLVAAKKRSPVFRRYHHQSMRDRHLDILRAIHLTAPEPLRAFDFFSKSEEAKMLNTIQKEKVKGDQGWTLVAPVAASGLKTWPLQKFQQVIREILKENDQQILLVGDSREREIAQPLTGVDPERVINLAGKLTIRESAALIARADLLLTNDSALMHIGFELNRPVVAVFGPTSAEKYGRAGERFRIVREPVHCSPCERPTCRFPRQDCFEDLTADKVIQACKELLYERAEAVR